MFLLHLKCFCLRWLWWFPAQLSESLLWRYFLCSTPNPFDHNNLHNQDLKMNFNFLSMWNMCMLLKLVLFVIILPGKTFQLLQAGNDDFLHQIRVQFSRVVHFSLNRLQAETGTWSSLLPSNGCNPALHVRWWYLYFYVQISWTVIYVYVCVKCEIISNKSTEIIHYKTEFWRVLKKTHSNGKLKLKQAQ